MLTLPVLAQSKQNANDKGYFSEIEAKAASFPQPRRDLVLNYINYLRTGKVQSANFYIDTLKKSAPKIGQPKLRFSIFEGDFDLCHVENGACLRGLGDLTEKYFVPKLEIGDKKALELLFVHTSLIQSDGAETENLESRLRKLKIPSRNKLYFDFLRKSDPLFVKFPNPWM